MGFTFSIRKHDPILFCMLAAALVFSTSLASASDRVGHLKNKFPPIAPALVLDGSSVHKVGNLQMNVTNWGFFGSLPKSYYDMSESPSAQWPAGSSIEYLYAAGLWVGARKDGIPSVTTAWPETEFYPSKDPVDVIYTAFEGQLGGERLPALGCPYPGIADDDQDGLVDEDWLNGRDDDGDGDIDEDFAAVGKQMFSCWYVDDQTWSCSVWPEHTPLNLHVRQESYQWSEDGFDEFIGVKYLITNTGSAYLSRIYLGIYADVDAGPREYGNYHMDDLVGFWYGIVCAKTGVSEMPVRVAVAYVRDDDGDKGKTLGCFGIVLLGHTTPDGDCARSQVSISGFKIFRGLQPFEDGGEPTNDFERYSVMDEEPFDFPPGTPNDYKFLLSCGPFRPGLDTGGSLELDIAFVCGMGLGGMIQSAAQAVLVYDGFYIDKDNDPATGVLGRETLVHGPREDFDPDACEPPDEHLALSKLESIWSNLDCGYERMAWNDRRCVKPMFPIFKDYQTGVNGRESQVRWMTGMAPPAPAIRVVPGDNRVTIFWDNFSEIIPDPMTREYDFEGYEIWRADGWDRPFGSSILTGPSHELWSFVAKRDLINGVPPDIDFKKPYQERGWQYEPLEGLRDKEKYITMFREAIWHAPYDSVPCPPGLSESDCDTLEALARHRLGFEGGRQYYKYIDGVVKNGMHLFYSVVAYDHEFEDGKPSVSGKHDNPLLNFAYVTPESKSQDAETYDEKDVYVVPNPVTSESIDPWRLLPNNEDPTGLKIEFRNLPGSRGTVRIFTLAGDLVEAIGFDGTGGCGTASWDLVSRNGQDVTSGIYLFAVECKDSRFPRTVGKFVVIR